MFHLCKQLCSMLGVIADYCGGKHFEYKAYALEQHPFFKRNCIYPKLGNNDTSSAVSL